MGSEEVHNCSGISDQSCPQPGTEQVNPVMSTQPGVVGRPYYIAATVNGVNVDAMLDEGSSVTLISENFVKRFPILNQAVQSAEPRDLRGFGSNSHVTVNKQVVASVGFDDLYSPPVPLLIAPSGAMASDVLLGMDFQERHY